MKRTLRVCFCLLFLIQVIYFSGCSGSDNTDEEYENIPKDKENTEVQKPTGSETASEMIWEKISKIAEEEQQNEMYSRSKDSTYIYWLNDQLMILENSSKCNIFALNVLYRSGCKCPDENALTYDLMDTLRFNDIFPVIYKSNDDNIYFEDLANSNLIKKGDLIIWNGHVIIFESFEFLNGRFFANAWWAGTKQENNGENIINDVVHGKYPIEGEYIVRRPLLNK